MKLTLLDPGHFHAALVQREMYPGVSERVDVYAPLGTDLTEHLNRIAAGEVIERLDVVESWMAKNAESIIGTTPGLEAWQWYGPSTRRGDTTYLHPLMRPYETVAVRGVPIRRLRSVRALADGRELQFTTRCAIVDKLLNADPSGEVTITVPEEIVDPYATVLALEVAGAT